MLIDLYITLPCLKYLSNYNNQESRLKSVDYISNYLKLSLFFFFFFFVSQCFQEYQNWISNSLAQFYWNCNEWRWAPELQKRD